MAGATIRAVRVIASHGGDAELCVTLGFANGGESVVTLEQHAARALLDATGAASADALVGVSWVQVRDALIAASGRFADAAA
jgi:hypothetical protein